MCGVHIKSSSVRDTSILIDVVKQTLPLLDCCIYVSVRGLVEQGDNKCLPPL